MVTHQNNNFQNPRITVFHVVFYTIVKKEAEKNKNLKVKIAHPQRTSGGMTGGRVDWVFEYI